MEWFFIITFLGGIQLILWGIECIDIYLYGSGIISIIIGIMMVLLAVSVIFLV